MQNSEIPCIYHKIIDLEILRARVLLYLCVEAKEDNRQYLVSQEIDYFSFDVQCRKKIKEDMFRFLGIFGTISKSFS